MSADQSPVALVTGAASGIGRATAHLLAEAGYAVCAIDRAKLDSLRAELQSRGAQVITIEGDVAELETFRTATRQAARVGLLRLAVLNAGIMTKEGDLRRADVGRIRSVVDTNILGVVNGAKAFLEAIGDGPASVVAVASSVGLVPAPHDPVYAMTKHAVVGFVRCLALRPELAQVRVNCICPNGVATDLLPQHLKEGRRLLSPESVAQRVVELAAMNCSGTAWVCTPDIFKAFEFPPNPGFEFPPLAQ